MTIKHGKQIDAPRRGRGGGRKLRPIRGALAMTLKACGDGRAFVLPAASAGEAALVRDAVVLPAKSLLDVCAHLMDRGALAQQPATAFASSHDEGHPISPTSKANPKPSAHSRSLQPANIHC